jgi:penicillin-binding protein 1C
VVARMRHQSWFVLPPVMEYYFKRNNVLYSTLPPLLPGCAETQEQLEFIYPREWNKLFIPVDLDGTPGKLIFELAHRQNNATVFWYLDEYFMGKTNGMHQLEVRPELGWHKINVTDNLGNVLTKRFMVVNKLTDT